MKLDLVRRQGLGWMLALVVTPCAAADLTVKVVDRSGAAVANAAVMVHTGAASPGAGGNVVEIRQARLRFAPLLQVVPVGTTLTFTNEDEFDHHVRGTSKHRDFEFMVPARAASGARPARAARKPPQVVLDKPDIVRLTCHLHSSMFAHVIVTDAALYAVTDERGEAVFAGAGEGVVKVSVWHPLQPTDLAPLALKLASRSLYVPISLTVALPAKP
jgi:plastocyanin